VGGPCLDDRDVRPLAAREVELAVARIGNWLAEGGLDDDLPSRIRDQVAASGEIVGGGAVDVFVSG
jgi:hypothetical protein